MHYVLCNMDRDGMIKLKCTIYLNISCDLALLKPVMMRI